MSNPEVKCHCENVGMGSYDNQVSIREPYGEHKWICVDTCLATIIGYLWKQDIVTLNSCCGHKIIKDGKIMKPTIIVDDKSVDKMLKLGYKNKPDYWCAMPENTFEV